MNMDSQAGGTATAGTSISGGSNPHRVNEARDLTVLDSQLQRFHRYADLPTDNAEFVRGGPLADIVNDAAGKAIQRCLDANRDPPGWVVQALMETGLFGSV